MSLLPRGEYKRRRRELIDLMEENSVAIVPGASPRIRNGDVTYRFRQDSNFSYLTGFDEPDAVFALVPGREHGEALLFCREATDEFDEWVDEPAGPDRARQLYDVDDAFPVSDIDEILPGLIEGRNKLYYTMGADPDFDHQIINWVRALAQNPHAHPPGEFVQLGHYLHEMRLTKTAAEIRILREAAAISVEAHFAAMRAASPGMMEYELQAELEYVFTRRGSRSAAYPSIVGSGANGCTLHYTRNDAVMRNGDLVLLDAGCELDGYASDITRTYPVNGKFTGLQRDVYEIVLAAQLAAIDATVPGNHWNHPHEAAVAVIAEGLRDLKLLEGSLDSILETENYKQFYMHRTGHWMGMDVHDVGEYQIDGEWRVFEPGMVLTVEPGLYFRDRDDTPAAFRGMGIRIEDNVLVTKNGQEVLTDALPKQVDDLEAEIGSA